MRHVTFGFAAALSMGALAAIAVAGDYERPAGGQWVDETVYAVVCKDAATGLERAELLDFFETTQQEFALVRGEPEKDYRILLDRSISRLKAAYPSATLSSQASELDVDYQSEVDFAPELDAAQRTIHTLAAELLEFKRAPRALVVRAGDWVYGRRLMAGLGSLNAPVADWKAFAAVSMQLPQGCEVRPLLLKAAEWRERMVDIRGIHLSYAPYLIDQDVLGKLDESQLSGAILHLALRHASYRGRDALRNQFKSYYFLNPQPGCFADDRKDLQKGLRELVGRLSTANWEEMSVVERYKLAARAGIRTLDAYGFSLQTCDLIIDPASLRVKARSLNQVVGTVKSEKFSRHLDGMIFGEFAPASTLPPSALLMSQNNPELPATQFDAGWPAGEAQWLDVELKRAGETLFHENVLRWTAGDQVPTKLHRAVRFRVARNAQGKVDVTLSRESFLGLTDVQLRQQAEYGVGRCLGLKVAKSGVLASDQHCLYVDGAPVSQFESNWWNDTFAGGKKHCTPDEKAFLTALRQKMETGGCDSQ